MEIRPIHAEEGHRFRPQGPLVGDASAELQSQRARGPSRVRHNARGELGAPNVVESEARGKEDVVFQGVGRAGGRGGRATTVVAPFPQQSDVDAGTGNRVERILGAEHGSEVVLFPADEIASARALNRLGLQQRGGERPLNLQTELADLGVVLKQCRLAGRVAARQQGGLPAGAVEYADTQVERPEAAAVSRREIEMPLPSGTLVLNVLVVDEKRQPQPPAASGEGARPVVRRPKHLKGSPVPEPGEVGHGLSQLGFAVEMLDEIHLIDDVDQTL